MYIYMHTHKCVATKASIGSKVEQFNIVLTRTVSTELKSATGNEANFVDAIQVDRVSTPHQTS